MSKPVFTEVEDSAELKSLITVHGIAVYRHDGGLLWKHLRQDQATELVGVGMVYGKTKSKDGEDLGLSGLYLKPAFSERELAVQLSKITTPPRLTPGLKTTYRNGNLYAHQRGYFSDQRAELGTY